MSTSKIALVLACTLLVVLFGGVSAFAAEDIALSVEELLDCNVVPYKDFDFTLTDARNMYKDLGASGSYTVGGVVDYDEERGLNLTSGSNWRYVPKTKWSSIDGGRVVFFRAKPLDQSSNMILYILDSTNANNKMYDMKISANGITTTGSRSFLDSQFQPGLNWVDYLVIKTSSGVKFYAKSVEKTNGEWKHILTETAPGLADSASSGLYFSGPGFVQRAVIYNTEETDVFSSLADALGNPCSAVYDFSMDTEFVMQDGMSSSGTYSVTEDGLVLGSGAEWSFCPTSSWAPLSGTDVVLLRLKLTEAKEDSLTVRINDNNGLAKFTVNSTGILAYGDRATSDTGVATTKLSFPGAGWVDYLVKRNNSGGYSVLVKNGSGDSNWYLAAETKDYPGDSQNNLGIKISGSGTVGAVRQYSPTNVFSSDVALPDNCETVYYGEEFTTIPSGQSNLTLKNGTSQDAKLVFSATDAEEGVYWIDNGGIPLGGYAELRLKVGSVGRFETADGERRISISFGDVADSLEALTTQNLYIGEGGDRYRVWRIIRNGNGTYSGYTRTDHENEWYQAFSGVTGIADAENCGTGLFVQGGTEGQENTLICDYIKICGPTQDARLLLTDGYGTKLATENSHVRYFDCIRALVTRNESKKQTVLFTEYVNDVLAGWHTEEVEAGYGVASVKYSARNSTAKIKVFLWDSVGDMLPEAEAMTSKVDWKAGGSVTDLDGGFVLTPSQGEETVLWLEDAIGESFDVEWRMTINAFTGNEQVRFYTGTEKICLLFTETGITYTTTEGEQQLSIGIGTEVHTYRLTKKDGHCYLYLDGSFVGEMTGFPLSNEKAKIEFSIGVDVPADNSGNDLVE